MEIFLFSEFCSYYEVEFRTYHRNATFFVNSEANFWLVNSQQSVVKSTLSDVNRNFIQNFKLKNGLMSVSWDT